MHRFLNRIAFAPENESGAAQQPAGASETGLVTDVAPGEQRQQEAPKSEGQTRAEQARAKGLFPKESPQPTNTDQQPQPLDVDARRPEGLPDKFWNAKEGTVNVEALNKAFKDTEAKLHQLTRQKSIGGEVPENEADYFKEPIKLPETVTNAKLEADDPGLKAWAQACKKHGLGVDIARALAVEMFVSMNDHLPAPIDPEQERAALGKEGPALADGLWTWAEGLERRGAFSEADVEIFDGLMGTAAGVRFLQKMRAQTGLEPIPVHIGGGSAQTMSPAEWQVAYSAAVKAKDYAEQERLEKIGEKINGMHAAGTSRSGSIGFTG